MKILAFLFVLLLPMAARATCEPVQATPGMIGCWPTVNNMSLTDSLDIWQPGPFPASANRIHLSNLLHTAPVIGDVAPNAATFTNLTATTSFTAIQALVQNTGANGGAGYASATIKTTGTNVFGPALLLDATSNTTGAAGHVWAVVSTGALDAIVPPGSYLIYDSTANAARFSIDPAGNTRVWNTLNVNGGATVLSGPITQPLFQAYTAASGSMSGQNRVLSAIYLTSDTVDANGSGDHEMTLFGVTDNFGGTSVTGGRNAIVANVNQTSDTPNGGANSYAALTGITTISGDLDAGFVYGLNTVSNISGSGTNVNALTGIEIDMSNATATPTQVETGIIIAHEITHQTAPLYASNAIAIVDQPHNTTASWHTGIAIGDYEPQNPMSSVGYAFQIKTGNFNAVQGISPHMAGAIDLAQGIYDGVGDVGGGFALRAPGSAILPGGANGGVFQVGYGSIAGASTGVTIDANYQQMTGTPAVQSGGTGWQNTWLAADAYGDIVRIATSPGGIVGTVTVITRGWSAAPPSNPVTFSPLSISAKINNASGLTLNLTWTAEAQVNLGSATTETVIGTGSALGTSATAGFLHLPFTTAAPTGTPGTVLGNACEINTATQSLNCYIGSSWYHVVLSSGAN